MIGRALILPPGGHTSGHAERDAVARAAPRKHFMETLAAAQQEHIPRFLQNKGGNQNRAARIAGFEGKVLHGELNGLGRPGRVLRSGTGALRGPSFSSLADSLLGLTRTKVAVAHSRL